MVAVQAPALLSVAGSEAVVEPMAAVVAVSVEAQAELAAAPAAQAGILRPAVLVAVDSAAAATQRLAYCHS